MAAAESERQVAQQQALGLRMTAGAHRGECNIALDLRWPSRQLRCHRFCRRAMVQTQVVEQIISLPPRAAGKNAAAHDVEEHVGAVVRGCHRIARSLECIRAGQQFVQTRSVARHGVGDLCGRASASVEASGQLEDLHLRKRAIDDLLQARWRRAELDSESLQKGASATAGQRLGMHLPGLAKGTQLCG